MPRRQTEVLRNLDTPLKVVGIITIKSCGVVLLYFVTTQALDLLGIWALLGGKWGFVLQNGSVLLLALALIYVERNEDEHLVPQAIRWFCSQYLTADQAGDETVGSRLFAFPRAVTVIVRNVLGRRQRVYSGLALPHHRPHPIEELLAHE